MGKVAQGWIVAGVLGVLSTGSATAQCTGDCNGNGTVAINELVTAVGIALETNDVSACPAADANDNGTVAINELVQAVGFALDGCPALTPFDTFPTSLHATRAGKRFFYSEENGGFETLTQIAYDALACQSCHPPTLADGTPVDPETYEPSCADCHADLNDPLASINDQLCLGCHSRQAAEIQLFDDEHRSRGFTCMSCHTAAEIHGDGNEYSSLLETQGPQCVDCHDPESNTAHNIHLDTVDCSSCHVRSVITCYNCHFDSEVAGGGKRFFAPPRRDFKFLLNFRGKVHPATMQALVFEGQSFYALAPYYAHTITDDVDCGDCHSSAALRSYRDTGEIQVTEYVEGELLGPSGVIPVPPDWRDAFKLDFLDYTGEPSDPETNPELWEFLKSGADGTQLLFGEPLRAEQIETMATALGGG